MTEHPDKQTVTLEELLRSHPNGRFRLNVGGVDPRWMKIYIHPDGEDGKTLDYYVMGDELVSPEDFEPFEPPTVDGEVI